VGCPCSFGEEDGDQGWCSGVLAFDIRSGEVDGVDVGGTKAMVIADWPRGYLAGNGKGRLYVDTGVSDEQRAGLEQALTGRAGGSLEALSALIPEWLPVQQAPISFDAADGGTDIKVGDIGQAVFRPLKNPDGGVTTVQNIPVAFTEPTILGRGDGTRFHDPDLREWESLGHGETGEFDWSG
jgi:hypothetical protein